ncbi:hypothetical protein H0H93_001191, partial [Arthromyces matolae]
SSSKRTLKPMRPLDPLLLGSFPAPPTHIPITPTSPNPPPSRPPSTPLPPTPGPSRFTSSSHRHHHRANESISSIDVRDILNATSTDDAESESGSDFDDDDDKLSALPPLARSIKSRRSSNGNLKHTQSLTAATKPKKPITRSFTFPTPNTTTTPSDDSL